MLKYRLHKHSRRGVPPRFDEAGRLVYHWYATVYLDFARASIFSIILFGMLACNAFGNETGTPRLALIATGDDRAEVVTALIEAQLTQRDDLVLLDRRRVNDLLGEQELLQSAQLSAGDAVHAGALLGCDLFAELRFHAPADSAVARGAVATLIAFDAATGIRLIDRTLPADRMPEALAEVVAITLAAMARDWLDPGDTGARTLSVGTVRNVNLKAGHSHLPAVLQPLIERNLLAADAGIALLERQRLDFVNREAGLAEDRRDRLLASMVLIDFDIMQGDQPDEVLIRAVLKSWGGRAILAIEQTGPATPLYDVANRMTVGILEALDIKAATGFALGDDIRRLEGLRYFGEADQHAFRNQWPSAAQAAEIAVALNPTHLLSLELLFDSIGRVAMQQAEIGAWTNSLDSLQRQVDVLDDLVSRRYTPNIWLTEAWAILIDNNQSLSPATRKRLELNQLRVRTIIMKRPDSRNWGAIVIWAPNPDAWLEDLLLMHDADIPEPLQNYAFLNTLYSRKVGKIPTHVNDKDWRRHGDQCLLYLSAAGKQRLLEYYQERAEGNDLHDCVAAIRYAHIFSGELPQARAVIKRILDRAIDLTRDAKPITVQELVVCIDEILNQPDHVDLYVSALLRLVSNAERRKLILPEAYLLLDQWHTNADPPGSYLVRAAILLRDSDYALRPAVRRAMALRETSSKQGSLRDLRHVYRKRYQSDMPGSEGDQALPGLDEIWEKEETLFTVTNRQTILTMEIHDDYLYIMLGEEKRWNHGIFELIQFNLLSGETRSLGTLRVETEWPSAYIVDMRARNLMSINETGIHYPAVNAILHYDFQGKTLSSVASEAGLPHVYFDAVISVGETWYLAATRFEPEGNKAFPYGDGMLLRYTPKRGSYEVLASSSRKETLSELDNCYPYRITDFYYDRQRHRLLFGVLSSRYDIERTYYYNTSEIWSYDIGNGEICRVSPQLRNAHAPRRVGEGVYLVDSDIPRRLTFWIPETDKYETLSFDAVYEGRGRHDGISHLMSPFHGARMFILHNRIYQGWMRLTIWPFDEQEMVVPTAPESVISEWEQNKWSSILEPGAIKAHGETLLFATPSRVLRMTPRRPQRIVAPEIEISLPYPRAVAGNSIEVRLMLPECDEIRWGLRQRTTSIERVAVTGPGHLNLSITIPADYSGMTVPDDTVVIWAYHQGKQVAQGSAAILIQPPYSPASMRDAFSEAIYGVAGMPSADGLAAWISMVQPGLTVIQDAENLDSMDWDIAIVDAGWLTKHGDSGRESVLQFLAQKKRSVLLTGDLQRNPFLPAWTMQKTMIAASQSGPRGKTNSAISVVDRQHGVLFDNAADWLTVNDWNQAPAIVPLAGGDDRPMNLRPIYADTVSGAPFIVELFPSDGGRLLSIPFNLPVAMQTEPYAGYLLYRAIRYLRQANEPQWKPVFYRDHSATAHWLHAIGVTSPQSINKQDAPDRLDQIMFFHSKAVDELLERWIIAGGTAILLTNRRGSAAEPATNDQYRVLLRGIAVPLIVDYTAVLAQDEQDWQSLLPPEYVRRPLLPGILDEVKIGAGRLLILAVPDTITPPARNLLSILLTNCEVRLGP